jgi:hypothetical protein
MVEGQFVAAAAILAGEPIAQENIEAGEGGMSGGTDILLERDHARQADLALGLLTVRSYSETMFTRSRNTAFTASCHAHRESGK